MQIEQSVRRIGYAAGIAMAVTVLGCRGEPSGELDQLGQNRDKWTAAGIRDYHITLKRVCFCSFADSVVVTVAGGQIASRTSATTGQPVPAQTAVLYPDIGGLFDLAEDAQRRAASFNVSFNEAYGYPETLTIDWVASTADDEVTYLVLNFGR